MQAVRFRNLCIFIAFLFTIVLLIAIASLFFVISYREIVKSLQTEELVYSLKLSILASSISTAVVLALAVPMGYAMARFHFPGKSVIKSLMDLPIAFPELVLGLCLLLLFGQTPVGKAMEEAGIRVVFTKLGIVVAQIFTALPYAARILYSTFESVNPRYELVSRSLGYGEFESFKNVTIPLARNGLFASTVITFARSMGAFGAVLILAGGSYMNTKTLPITLYLNISYGNIGVAITSGIVLVVLAFLAILVFEKVEGGL